MDVAVKIEDISVKSRLQWYDYVIYPDTNLKLHEVMILEIDGKKKGHPRKSRSEQIKIKLIWCNLD